MNNGISQQTGETGGMKVDYFELLKDSLINEMGSLVKSA